MPTIDDTEAVDHRVTAAVTLTYSDDAYVFSYTGLAIESSNGLAARVSSNGDLDLENLTGTIRVRFVLTPNTATTPSGTLALWFKTTESVWINQGDGQKPTGPYSGTEFQDFTNGSESGLRPRTVQFVVENTGEGSYLYALRVRAELSGQPPIWIVDDPELRLKPPTAHGG